MRRRGELTAAWADVTVPAPRACFRDGSNEHPGPPPTSTAPFQSDTRREHPGRAQYRWPGAAESVTVQLWLSLPCWVFIVIKIVRRKSWIFWWIARSTRSRSVS